ncbi:uncharacterized protein IL334_001266 [Kwoniella shivajii]|uniref:HMG box domain-containing protein n=1 Tax=Kwoniella shivajii TaxID=564305 RepID=A0ABZ1CSJ1_9TREE|nr:hypothetical protein IL334_001266 [Kwoniella shivajii]
MSSSSSECPSGISELTGSPVPSSSCVDSPEFDFDLNLFLQSCSEFMSQPLTPSPIFDVPTTLLRPDVPTPPYTSDEGSVIGDHDYLTDKHRQRFLTPQITLTMTSNRSFTAHQSPDPSIPSSSSMSQRTSQSSSQSHSPPLTYSFNNPNIFASYPQSYPTTSYFPHHPTIPPPASLASSPPWQTTDTEANASGLDVDLDIDLDDQDQNTMTDIDGRTSGSTAYPIESKLALSSSKPKSGTDAIPRPPNAWILYRSDILKDLAAGNDIPNLDITLAKMGYGATTSASSDESNLGGLTDRGKSREVLDSHMMPPPTSTKTKYKKVKSQGREPTEEFLSLGRGKTGKGLPQAHISKLISTLWKNETPDRRAFYEQKANLRKIEHQKKYPDYKFQPMRKADKIKQREDKEREREVIKRQKEADKQAGKGKRHHRQRTRISPSSPYSVLNSAKRPETVNLARSLSYTGESDKQRSHWWKGESTARGAAHRLAEHSELRYQLGADPLSVYPFPLPIGALPALAPEDATLYQQRPPGATIAEDYRSWQHDQNYSPANMKPVPAVSVVPVQDTFEAVSVLTTGQHLPPNKQSGVSTSSHLDPSLQLPHAIDQSSTKPWAYSQPLQGLGVYPSAHSAIPFIADPLPIDSQGRPMPILGLDDIEPFPEDDNGDPAMLAEMWWNLRDDDVREDMQNAAIPSGLLADERTLQVFDIEADEAGQSSTTRVSGLSTGPPSGTTSAAPPTPSSSFVPQEGFGSGAQGAYPYPQGYVPMYVSVIPEDGNIDPSIPFFSSGYDANLPYLAMDASFDPSLYGYPGVPYGEQGPFLSSQQPMSPTDSWSAGPTPREATFLRAAQSQESNRVASSSSDGTVRAVSSNQSAPRYVSSSAYPLTPHSQDPTALPGTGGILDRNSSFSALAAVMSGQHMGMGVSEDMLGWDDNDVIENEEESEVEARKDRVMSNTHRSISKIPTPISVPTPYTSPKPGDFTNQAETALNGNQVPARRSVAVRSRAVASKFGGGT